MAATGPAHASAVRRRPLRLWRRRSGGGADTATSARVRHFHAKNIRPAITAQVRAEGCRFLQGVVAGAFTVPGDQEGGIDFRAAAEDPRRGGL